MNSLLIFLVRHDNKTQLAAHLVAGIAALLLLIGTSRSDAHRADAAPAVQALQVQASAPARGGRTVEPRKVELPIAAVAASQATRR